jgi:hypothetical protein
MRVIRRAIDFLLTFCSLQYQMDGLTGNVQIDPSGRRSHFKLDIVEFFMGELKKVGWWETGRGVNRTQTETEKLEEIQKSLQFKNFTVVARLVSPVITPFLSLACKFCVLQYSTLALSAATGVPRGGFGGFKPPRNYSEVLTNSSRIPSSMENTS